jgi:hypothetical protein
MIRSYLPMAVVATLATVSATPARAEFIRSSTGIPSPVSTVTFDEHIFPRFTQVTTQYLDVGLTFTPRAWYDVILAELPNITGHRVGNSAVGELDDPMSVRFATPRTAAALALACNSSNVTFTALLAGSVVESTTTTANTTTPENFYGFTGIVFDEVRISQQVLSGSPGFIIDNIQLGAAVPGPAGVALAAFTLALAVRRRR